MTEISCQEYACLKKVKSREYKCPCGKTYLSYAALFTHIKQKHEGIAPGRIQKPKCLNKKRGRPPIKSRKQKNEQEINKEFERNMPETETKEDRQRRENMTNRSVQNIVCFFKNMPIEELNKKQLNQIQAFAEMSVHLNIQSKVTEVFGNICMADGLAEFLRDISEGIQWWKFEHLYILFMLFLQFIIDGQNNKRVIIERPMDLFCEYVNQFLQDHLQDMAQYYEVHQSWLLKKQNALVILQNFFLWLMGKKYTHYIITLQC